MMSGTGLRSAPKLAGACFPGCCGKAGTALRLKAAAQVLPGLAAAAARGDHLDAENQPGPGRHGRRVPPG